jgi:parallel beta-helix repeat protein
VNVYKKPLGRALKVVWVIWIVALSYSFLLVNLIQKINEVTAQGTRITYYVSTNGSDANNGTSLSTPFRTINKAAGIVNPGDTVLVRGGVYQERVQLNRGGISSARITFSAYQDEIPVIDGSNLSLGCVEGTVCRVPIFGIGSTGDYITVKGFTIKNSAGRGIGVSGDYTVIDNIKVSNSFEAGISIWRSIGSEVRNSEIWDNVRQNVSHDGTTIWAAGLTAFESHDGKYINNKVYGNHGEGISAWKGTKNFQILGNTVYDNYSVNIYLDNSYNALVENNLVYETETSYIEPTAGNTVESYVNGKKVIINNSKGRELATGISISEEDYFGFSAAPSPFEYQPCNLHHNKIRNNIIINTRNGIDSYNYLTNCPSGWKDSIIENNTVVDSWDAGIKLTNGVHERNLFRNNIIHSKRDKVVSINKPNDIKFFNNIFYFPGGSSSSKFTWSSNSYDFNGFELLQNNSNNKWEDPKLANLSQLNSESKRLQTGSPAIDGGSSNINPTTANYTPNTRDFFSSTRPIDGNGDGVATIDIGAHEYINSSAITPIPTYSSSTFLARIGWSIAASSTSQWDTLTGAIDGNLNTRWSTGSLQTNGQWFQIDLGGLYSINGIVMDAGSSNDYPRGYEVYLSSNGTNWESRSASGTGQQITDIAFPSQHARYIKIVQTGIQVLIGGQ